MDSSACVPFWLAARNSPAASSTIRSTSTIARTARGLVVVVGQGGRSASTEQLGELRISSGSGMGHIAADRSTE